MGRAGDRILVATDGSETSGRACERIISLMEGRLAEFRLLVVLSFELDPQTLLGEDLADAPERRRMESEAIESATGELRRSLERAGHSVSLTSRFGNPADEILSEIDEWAPSLVVMGRRGLSMPARILLGSVSDHVIRHASVPVLIVP